MYNNHNIPYVCYKFTGCSKIRGQYTVYSTIENITGHSNNFFRKMFLDPAKAP